MFEEKIPTKNSIIKTITKMVKIDSILNLYSDFYKYINREDMFKIKKIIK